MVKVTLQLESLGHTPGDPESTEVVVRVLWDKF